ncbi:hypothetical protein ACHAXT_005026 [Thalassiosira profunda]
MNPKGPGHPGRPHPTPQHRRKLSGVGAGGSAAVPPAELASALAFLGEKALLGACDILLAQSEELFGAANGDVGSNQTKCNDAGEIAKERPADSHVDQLSALYQQSKNAHDVVIRADEDGMLSESPRANAPPPIGAHPSPMVHRAASSGMMGVKPPPSLSRGMSGSSTPALLRARGSFSGVGSNMASLLQRKVQSDRHIGSGGANKSFHRGGSTGLAERRHAEFREQHENVLLDRPDLREKVKLREAPAYPPGEEGNSKVRLCMVEGCATRHQANCDYLCTTHNSLLYPEKKGVEGSQRKGAGGEEASAPPPEALSFLKALNAGKRAAVGPGEMEPIDEEVAAGTQSMTAATPLKRKAKSPPPPPSHPPPPKRERPAMPSEATSRSKSFTHVERAPPPPPKESLSAPETPAPPSKTPDQRSTRSRRSTPSSAGSKSSTYKTYGIGESVLAMRNGEKRAAIVKNVHTGSDEEGEGGGDDALYEVEFSDGEIWDVGPGQMFENEDD